MSKPHICISDGTWVCQGGGVISSSRTEGVNTPLGSFKQWSHDYFWSGGQLEAEFNEAFINNLTKLILEECNEEV